MLEAPGHYLALKLISKKYINRIQRKWNQNRFLWEFLSSNW